MILEPYASTEQEPSVRDNQTNSPSPPPLQANVQTRTVAHHRRAKGVVFVPAEREGSRRQIAANMRVNTRERRKTSSRRGA